MICHALATSIFLIIKPPKLIAMEENNNNNIDIDLLLNMSKKFIKFDS